MVDDEHLVGNLGMAINGGSLEPVRAAPTGSSADMALSLPLPQIAFAESRVWCGKTRADM
jgi:hypothetical protein